MISIRLPNTPDEWDDYYRLRYLVLRKPLGQPEGSERDEGDFTGEHFALYEDDVLRAIARLDVYAPTISQVRFVAVDTSIQGKGLGKLIMKAVENRSKETGNTKMILHARDYAVPFYEKLNYNIVEKSYKLFDFLQHYLMEKEY